MKIVFYTHMSTRGNGGTESLLSTLKIVSKTHECLVILPEKGEVEADFKKIGVEVSVLPNKRISRAKNYVSITSPKHSLLVLKKWFKNYVYNRLKLKTHCEVVSQFEADIVYSNTSIIGIGAMVAKALNLPHLWHLREFQSLDHKLYPDFFWMTFRSLVKNSSLVVVNSEAMKSFYKHKVDQDKIRVIYNAIEPFDNVEPFRSKEAGFVFLMVGKLSEGKGHLEALKAVKLLVEQDASAFKLKIVGDGKEEESLKQFVKDNNLTDYVEFCGVQRDVSNFYAISNCYLMCSSHEAFGRVTVEAMLHKLPVVGFKNEFCGTQEIIRDTIDGLLYSGSYIELANKMQWMIDHSDKAIEMGDEGFRRANEMFAIEVYAEKILRALHDVKLSNLL